MIFQHLAVFDQSTKLLPKTETQQPTDQLVIHALTSETKTAESMPLQNVLVRFASISVVLPFKD